MEIVKGSEEWKARHRAYCRDWYAKNKEKAAASSKRWEQANREMRSERNRIRRELTGEKFSGDLMRRYGISVERYESMLEAQGGCCAICKKVQTGRRLFVDHDHATGAVRGILCQKCNSGIGMLGDTSNGVRSALAYLEKHEVKS